MITKNGRFVFIRNIVGNHLPKQVQSHYEPDELENVTNFTMTNGTDADGVIRPKVIVEHLDGHTDTFWWTNNPQQDITRPMVWQIEPMEAAAKVA